MTQLTLDSAREIIRAALAYGETHQLQPLSVLVLDAGGNVQAFERSDGSSNLRFQVAHGKAYGALGLGVGSRALFERAQQQPYFISAVNAAAGGALIPVPGGVLIRGPEGLIGAVGVTGDSSDNDEAAAIAGIEAAGFTPDAG